MLFLLSINQQKVSDFAAHLLSANLRAGCSVCGIPPTAFMRNMDEYLDDVVSLVNDYPNANFATVVAELKIVNGNGSFNTRKY